MDFGLGTILAAAWTAVGMPLLVRGFQWIGSTINRNKTMESTHLDDAIRLALRTAISNVGNRTADAIKANPENWVNAAKNAARSEAKDQAMLLLDEKARKRFHEIGDAGINVLIRKLVDDRDAMKPFPVGKKS